MTEGRRTVERKPSRGYVWECQFFSRLVSLQYYCLFYVSRLCVFFRVSTSDVSFVITSDQRVRGKKILFWSLFWCSLFSLYVFINTCISLRASEDAAQHVLLSRVVVTVQGASPHL